VRGDAVPLKYLPDANNALVVRTDFSSEAARHLQQTPGILRTGFQACGATRNCQVRNVHSGITATTAISD
jgi:hypothetical protein